MSARQDHLRWTVRCALAALLLVVTARPASAQNLFPVQGLVFGDVRPNVPMVVSPTDPQRRAELELRGVGINVQITFELPTALVSTSGHTLPVRFGLGDGLLVLDKSGLQLPFDPTSPIPLIVPKGENKSLLYLGGTADPGADQAPGVYTAVVTVQVVKAGI